MPGGDALEVAHSLLLSHANPDLGLVLAADSDAAPALDLTVAVGECAGVYGPFVRLRAGFVWRLVCPDDFNGAGEETGGSSAVAVTRVHATFIREFPISLLGWYFSAGVGGTSATCAVGMPTNEGRADDGVDLGVANLNVTAATDRRVCEGSGGDGGGGSGGDDGRRREADLELSLRASLMGRVELRVESAAALLQSAPAPAGTDGAAGDRSAPGSISSSAAQSPGSAHGDAVGSMPRGTAPGDSGGQAGGASSGAPAKRGGGKTPASSAWAVPGPVRPSPCVVKSDSGEERLRPSPLAVELYAWGRGEHGALGLGDVRSRPRPGLVLLDGVRRVAL